MKTLFITIVLLVCVNAGFSQQENFLRVFGFDDLKIAGGQLLGTTDSSVILTNGKYKQEIKFTAISFIKTKRSFGHTMLVTGGITAAAFFTFSLLTTTGAQSFLKLTTGQAIAAILPASLVMGASVGTIVEASKRRDTFKVNGHYKEWQGVRVKLDEILEQQKKVAPAG